jgi:hypothetical protein
MQKLEDVVNVTGIGMLDVTAECVRRDGNIAMYLRSDDVYEVFKVKVSPEADIFGRHYPERETYPCNEDFGTIAWSYRNIKDADRKWNKLLLARDNAKNMGTSPDRSGK